MKQGVTIKQIEPSSKEELVQDELIQDELLRLLRVATESKDDDAIKFEEICKSYPDKSCECLENSFSLALRKTFIGIYVARIKVNGKEANVLLDTGAEMTVFSDSFLQKVGVIWSREDVVGVNSFNDTRDEMNIALVEYIKISELMINNWPVIVIDNKKLRFSVLGKDIFRIDGVIGWDILSTCNFELDYRNLEFRVIHSGVDVGAKVADTTFPTILLNVAGEHRPYGFDTGASKSWLSKKMVKNHGLEVVSTKKKTIRGAHGKEKVVTDIIKEHEVILGDYQIKFENIRTGFTEYLNGYELDGVLGSDVLKNHTIRFDNVNGLCRLLS